MAARPIDDAFALYVLQAGMARPEQVEAARRMAEIDGTISLAEALLRQRVLSPEQRNAVERTLEGQGPVHRLGGFRIVRKIGEGGMGAVYLAEDPGGRKVALKVLPRKSSADTDFAGRFRREAEAAIQLRHPNIVQGYSINEDRGFHFYVMEYCEGEPLDALLHRLARLPVDEATRVVLQVARGLHFAHRLGFLHRDIKPGNILLAHDGTPRILDFGLTKHIGGADGSFRTQTGITVGTPHYMAPEQARGERDLDGRVDIYSLGATYYHLLTGDTPFHGAGAVEIISRHLSDQLPDPRDLREEIPDSVVHVIRRMMAKKPGDRHRDCGVLIADLEEVSAGRPPTTAELDAARSVIAVRARRHRRPSGRPTPAWSGSTVALAIGVLCTLIIFFAMARNGGAPERPEISAPPKETVAARILPPPQEAPKPVEAKIVAAPASKAEVKDEPPPSSAPAPAAKTPPRVDEPKPSEPTAPPPSAPPPVPEPAKAPEPVKPAAAPPTPAPRPALPPPAKLRQAEDRIRKARKADFDRRSRADRLALAKLLFQEGKIAMGDPVEAVALLRLSGELYAEAGDVDGLFGAAEAIQGVVECKDLEAAEKILERIALTTRQPEIHAILAEEYETLSERLVGEDQFDAAVRAGEMMEKVARLSANLELLARAQLHKRRLSELHKASVSFRSAQKTLEQRPDDSAASLQVGRFLCFHKRDWEKGIPYLVRGSDAALRAVAEQDQGNPRDPEAMAALGDVWAGLAAKAGAQKPAVQERAMFWYRNAWTKSQGTVRERLRNSFRSAYVRLAPSLKGSPGLPAGWLEGSAGDVGLSFQDDAVAKNGVCSARVSRALHPEGAGYVSFQTPYLPVAEGEEFVLSGWILSDGTRPGAAADNLRVSFFRARDARVGVTLIELPYDQPYWTFVQKSTKAPPGTTLAIISVWIYSPSGTVWADDVSLRRVSDRKEIIENGGMEKRP